VHFPRWVAFREIQFREVIIVGLDVWAFGDSESHVREDSREFIGYLGDRVHAAGFGRCFAYRQGDVHGFGVEPGVERRSTERIFRRGDGRGDAVLHAIDCGTVLLALVRRHAAERFEKRGYRSALAERGNAHGFQRHLVLR
jgi:hypothetical protein